MSDNEGETTIFDEAPVAYIKTKIFSSYPKLVAGAKFDKAFCTEDNA